MVSGGGTNLQALIDACADGRIPAKITGIISSKSDAYAIERAAKAGIPKIVLNKKHFNSPEAHEAAIIDAIECFEGQAVILAGYMSILGSRVVNNYKIINVHPALIPSFCGKGYYGLNVHKAVLDYGAKLSGATVHFVDEGTDTGPIIMQKSVEVKPDDTPEVLQKRVLDVEHEILVNSVSLLCRGRLSQKGRTVIITGDSTT